MFPRLVLVPLLCLSAAHLAAGVVNDDSLLYCGANGWSVFNGHCYKLFGRDYVGFRQAEQLCKWSNAEAVSIHSAEENAFVTELAADDFAVCTEHCAHNFIDEFKPPTIEGQPRLRSFWIGLHRIGSRGGGVPIDSCSWSDGTPCDYGNKPVSNTHASWEKIEPNYPWSTGQPSGTFNFESGEGHPDWVEGCAHLWWTTGWWNDLSCDGLPVAGIICKKPIKCT